MKIKVFCICIFRYKFCFHQALKVEENRKNGEKRKEIGTNGRKTKETKENERNGRKRKEKE